MNAPDLVVAFTAGLLAPLGAACVLPLYPGYLSFLAGQAGEIRSPPARILLGVIAGSGILVAMVLFGLIVVSLLSLPLSRAVGIIAPAAYILLGIIGILLVSGWNPEYPSAAPQIPATKRPFLGAFLFGLFFGVLILPCNVAPVAVLLALSTSAADVVANMFNFLLFGAGMAVPLVAISALSAYRGNEVATLLAKHKRLIHRVTGVLMIGMAVYYLMNLIPITG
jgi:cytochrome c-type biogenesis protein